MRWLLERLTLWLASLASPSRPALSERRDDRTTDEVSRAPTLDAAPSMEPAPSRDEGWIVQLRPEELARRPVVRELHRCGISVSSAVCFTERAMVGSGVVANRLVRHWRLAAQRAAHEGGGGFRFDVDRRERRAVIETLRPLGKTGLVTNGPWEKDALSGRDPLLFALATRPDARRLLQGEWLTAHVAQVVAHHLACANRPFDVLPLAKVVLPPDLGGWKGEADVLVGTPTPLWLECKSGNAERVDADGIVRRSRDLQKAFGRLGRAAPRVICVVPDERGRGVRELAEFLAPKGVPVVTPGELRGLVDRVLAEPVTASDERSRSLR